MTNPGPETRTVQICGGGDWHDASVELLQVPVGVAIEEERAARRLWFDEEYIPALRALRRGQKRTVEYMSLSDWLIQRCGAAWDETVEQVKDV